MKPPKSKMAELAPNATGGEKSHAETAESAEFKMTELGPIPVDWEVRRLGEICSEYAYGTGAESVDYDGKNKYIRITDIDEDSHLYSPSTLVSPSFFSEWHIVKDNDLLVARTGASVGKTYFYSKRDGKLIFAGFLMKANVKHAEGKFIFYWTLTDYYKRWVLSESARSGQPGINIRQLQSLLLPLPPLAEQRRIARALSDVDELISALGKLIEKKRNIKTGTMQELLGMRNEECGMRNVPRRRLTGFSGAWVEKRLGDCGFCFNGITGKAGNDFGHGEAHYITFLNVLSNVVIDTDMLDTVDIKSGENQNEVRCGDLFFNTSSETPEEVGFCAALDEEVTSVYLNSFCFGFRLTDDNVSGKFLAYWFRATGGRTLMTFLAQGSTRYNLSKDAFREACISIPPTLAEQQAIAAVLSDMDAEIAALEAKRAKYESIKQGMMQELLTGKTRLA